MRTVVAVLRGGPSREYDVSLKSGAAVLEHLNKELYDPRDIFISRNDVWHLHGAPTNHERALRDVDVAFNALHGEYGEDGQVQSVLQNFGVPFTGSGAFASALAFDKQQTKQLIKKLGVTTPRALVVEMPQDVEQAATNIFRSFPHPAVVKPVVGGSSIGVSIADSYHSFVRALNVAFEISPKVLVEEYIRGREATVGVVDNFRGEKTYTLLPVEIIPPDASMFYDYHAKYVGETQLICPGTFSAEVKNNLQELAKKVHQGMGLAHYSRSDFIIGKRGIYFLEVNTLPGLTEHSNIPHALRAVGVKFSDFLHHLISLARGRRGE